MSKVFDYLKSDGDDPVARLEAELEYTAGHLGAALDEIDQLRTAMRDCKCPSDATYTVGECIDRGTCGCTPGAILTDRKIPSRAHEGAGGGEPSADRSEKT